MDIDKLEDLIAKRRAIDAEIVACVGVKGRAPQKCSKCGQEGHSSRTCTQEKAPA